MIAALLTTCLLFGPQHSGEVAPRGSVEVTLGLPGGDTPLAGENECSKLLGYPSYTQEQKNMVPALTYEMIFEAGENIVPVVKVLEDGTIEVCVPGSLLNIPQLITDDTYLAKFAENKAEKDAATAAAQAKEEEARQEIATNPLCSGNLSDVAEKVLNEDNVVEAVVKLARCTLALDLVK